MAKSEKVKCAVCDSDLGWLVKKRDARIRDLEEALAPFALWPRIGPGQEPKPGDWQRASEVLNGRA